jgi:hypothetical protein
VVEPTQQRGSGDYYYDDYIPEAKVDTTFSPTASLTPKTAKKGASTDGEYRDYGSVGSPKSKSNKHAKKGGKKGSPGMGPGMGPAMGGTSGKGSTSGAVGGAYGYGYQPRLDGADATKKGGGGADGEARIDVETDPYAVTGKNAGPGTGQLSSTVDGSSSSSATGSSHHIAVTAVMVVGCFAMGVAMYRHRRRSSRSEWIPLEDAVDEERLGLLS